MAAFVAAVAAAVAAADAAAVDAAAVDAAAAALTAALTAMVCWLHIISMTLFWNSWLCFNISIIIDFRSRSFVATAGATGAATAGGAAAACSDLPSHVLRCFHNPLLL